MKISFLTPYLKQNRGNSTTAKRIITGLKERGVDVFTFAYDEEDYTKEISDKLKESDLLHILHFTRFSKWMKQEKFELTKPFIVTSGGTDVNHDIFNENFSTQFISLLEKALFITVFTEDGKGKIEQAFNIKDKVKVISQSVWLNGSKKDLNLPIGSPKILLPSGLRKVKDVLYLIEEIKVLQKEHPRLQFVMAGPIIEEEVYQEVLSYSNRFSWITLLTDIPFENMTKLLEWADYCLNTSISEGQSLAVMEAMSLGKIVMVRNNPGNASIITSDVNGFIFNNPKEFKEKFKEVEQNSHLKNVISKNAIKYIEQYHKVDDEIENFITLYKKGLNIG